MLLRNCLPQLRLVTRNTGNTMSADAVISYDEVKKLISSGQGRIIDVRTAEEVSNGKIPGATNIPVTQVEDALKMDLETFKWKYHVEKPQLEDHNLVFYCQLGKRVPVIILELTRNGQRKKGNDWAKNIYLRP
ncbi:thiosulfate:glutathione sulfurtransferase isoform 3-T3 [Anomaloglossus baeobatrachus]|uniref:thiosulfate:glutathione sulfurtransferase isoform X3 n=1 Tax=Anomaloglossus baeobatrachus TaxID=238106 RepID=UPI003F4F901C